MKCKREQQEMKLERFYLRKVIEGFKGLLRNLDLTW